MLFLYIFLQGQPIEEVTSLLTTQNVTGVGLLLVASYFLYKELQSNKTESKAEILSLRAEIKELNNKVIEVQGNALKVILDFTRALEDNTKALSEHGKLVERLYDKIQGT